LLTGSAPQYAAAEQVLRIQPALDGAHRLQVFGSILEREQVRFALS
jgi:hypothetical protein